MYTNYTLPGCVENFDDKISSMPKTVNMSNFNDRKFSYNLQNNVQPKIINVKPSPKEHILIEDLESTNETIKLSNKTKLSNEPKKSVNEPTFKTHEISTRHKLRENVEDSQSESEEIAYERDHKSKSKKHINKNEESDRNVGTKASKNKEHIIQSSDSEEENYKKPIKKNNKTSNHKSKDLQKSESDEDNNYKVHITESKSKEPNEIISEAKINKRSASLDEVSSDYFNLVSSDLKQFINSIPPKDILVKCRITRDKHGIDRGLYPIYYMHLERDDGKKSIILAARKNNVTSASTYTISVDPIDLNRNGTNYVGKLKNSNVGKNFTLFDDGDNPTKVGIDGNIRRELAAVIYESSILGYRGPRKMNVIIPDLDNRIQKPFEIRPTQGNHILIERFKRHKSLNIMHLENKNPIWNETTGTYALNFHGRVLISSVKNFQIIYPNKPDVILLQFGKIHKDVFNCDFKYPFSALQAFGIALTSLEV